MTQSSTTRWLTAGAVVAIAALAFNLDGYPLLDPDEGRNAEVAREMAASNDYVLPRLNDLPYVDKPLLYFTVGAAIMEVLGPTVFAARLPSLLFTLATVGLVAWVTRRWFGDGAARLAVLVTAATPFTLAYARTVIFDAALTFWVVLAIVAFYRAVERGGTQSEPPARPPDRPSAEEDRDAGLWWRAAAWAALALGVLTKGPVALAVPIMVVLPYAVWRGAARRMIDATSALVFVALILPWVYAISREVPEYLSYVLVVETAQRLTTGALQRGGPWWYFLAIFPAAVLPWTPLLISWTIRAVRDGSAPRSGDPAIRPFVLLALWIVVPLVFFSVSQSKRPQYVLPLVPAVGILIGALWSERRLARLDVRIAAAVLVALGAVFVAAATAIPAWVSATPEVTAVIPVTARVLGTICGLAGALAFVAGDRPAAFLCLALPVAAIPVVSDDLMDAIGRHRSAVELARAIDATLAAQPEVVGIEAYPLSLPFYLRRTMMVATPDAAELTSNYLVRQRDAFSNHPSSTLRPADWWRDALITCLHPRVFVVRVTDSATRRALAERTSLIAENDKYAVYGPCGVSEFARGTRGR